MDNPPCDTPDHDCVQDSGGLREICVPRDPYPGGRAIGAVCFDHRQCEDGICFTKETNPDNEWEGYCTRTCDANNEDCPSNWNCIGVCRKPNDSGPQPNPAP